MQGVTVTPKFVFGVNGEIKDCLHIVEEKKLIYVAGHNIIIYNTDEQTQYFIPGSPNSDAINYITISATQKYLAICERGSEHALCTIYDIVHRKKKKTIPDEEVMEVIPYQAKEFLNCAFSVKNERQQLVTLCGEPDW